MALSYSFNKQVQCRCTKKATGGTEDEEEVDGDDCRWWEAAALSFNCSNAAREWTYTPSIEEEEAEASFSSLLFSSNSFPSGEILAPKAGSKGLILKRRMKRRTMVKMKKKRTRCAEPVGSSGEHLPRLNIDGARTRCCLKGEPSHCLPLPQSPSFVDRHCCCCCW